MTKYIFTFGLGGPNAHVYQPVSASGWEEARKAMLDKHGTKWAFQYTEEEFEDGRGRGYFSNLEPLETLQAE